MPFSVPLTFHYLSSGNQLENLSGRDVTESDSASHDTANGGQAATEHVGADRQQNFVEHRRHHVQYRHL